MDRQDGLVSVDELCRLLKVRKSYVYKLTSRNMIPFYRIGGLKFRLSEVEAWLEKNKIKAAQPKTIERLLKEI